VGIDNSRIATGSFTSNRWLVIALIRVAGEADLRISLKGFSNLQPAT